MKGPCVSVIIDLDHKDWSSWFLNLNIPNCSRIFLIFQRVDLSSFGKGERPLLDVLSDLRNSDIVKKIEADNTKYENA